MVAVSPKVVTAGGVGGAAEVCWSGGVATVLEGGSRPVGDVVLSVFPWVGGSGRPAGLFSFYLAGVRARFLSLDGSEVVVQSFRYEGVTGGERILTWCGSCGDVAQMDPVELLRMSPLECRKCAAGVSCGECRAWHAFGRCGACPQLVP